MDVTQRVEERLPRESLVKWKSITSTLNHLNWFRHGPKVWFFLSHSLSFSSRGDEQCARVDVRRERYTRYQEKEGEGEEKMRGGKYR